MPKEPLSLEEQKILLKDAKDRGFYEGSGWTIDLEQLVLFFIDTGCHTSVLAEKRCDLRTKTEEGRLYIVWGRPKKKGIEAYTRIRASKRIKKWAEAFIGTQRPSWRRFYNDAVKSLCNEGYKGLSKKNLCPIALRHTFGVNMLRRGVSESTLKQLMNCSERTLRYYLKFTNKMIDEKLDEIGW